MQLSKQNADAAEVGYRHSWPSRLFMAVFFFLVQFFGFFLLLPKKKWLANKKKWHFFFLIKEKKYFFFLGPTNFFGHILGLCGRKCMLFTVSINVTLSHFPGNPMSIVNCLIYRVMKGCSKIFLILTKQKTPLIS